MVHASVRAVGEVAGGPDEIHLAIRDALSDDGTLMMYASCPQYVDEVGRGNLTADKEAEVLEKLPPFDANTARSARDSGAKWRNSTRRAMACTPTGPIASSRESSTPISRNPGTAAA